MSNLYWQPVKIREFNTTRGSWVFLLRKRDPYKFQLFFLRCVTGREGQKNLSSVSLEENLPASRSIPPLHQKIRFPGRTSSLRSSQLGRHLCILEWIRTESRADTAMTYPAAEGQPEGGTIQTIIITIAFLWQDISFVAKQEVQASFHLEQLWNVEVKFIFYGDRWTKEQGTMWCNNTEQMQSVLQNAVLQQCA